MSSYIDTAPDAIDPGHSWVEHTRRNLAWHYGPAHASAIQAGNDPATMADVARWNGLGQRSAA